MSKTRCLNLQLELFRIELAISEFELKRKELKAQLAKLGAGTKVCTKCEEEMDLEQFYLDKQKIDGRHSWCQECVRAAATARYHRKQAA